MAGRSPDRRVLAVCSQFCGVEFHMVCIVYSASVWSLEQPVFCNYSSFCNNHYDNVVFVLVSG
jgi:hypothetical protein